MATAKEKIRKLLALAESPNENEARLALLKARALMAEHKLTERDLGDPRSQKVIYEETSISCTAMTNLWASALGNVIAQHYCCKCIRVRDPGSKTHRIAFLGLEDDFYIAKKMFLYAYDCVISQCNRIRKEKKRAGWATPDIRKACNAYGNGFAAGVNQMYQEQEKDHSDWGLVMATPKPVTDYLDTLKLRKTKFGKGDERWTHQFRERGLQEGKNFSPSKRIN